MGGVLWGGGGVRGSSVYILKLLLKKLNFSLKYKFKLIVVNNGKM